MRARILLVLLPAVLLRAGEEPVQDRVQAAAEKEGIKLAITAKKTAAAGGPYLVRLEVTNLRDTPVWHDGGNHGAFKVAVTDPSGEPAPETRFGSKAGKGPRGRIWSLKPAAPYAATFNLARMFDLSERGEYRITVRKKIYPRRGTGRDAVQLELVGVPFPVREPTAAEHARWRGNDG